MQNAFKPHPAFSPRAERAGASATLLLQACCASGDVVQPARIAGRGAAGRGAGLPAGRRF